MDVRVIVSTAEKGWFYDYQTLIAGALAVIAAIIAALIARGQLAAAKAQVQVTRNQIDAAQGAENRRLAGQRRAARATLTAALSAICDYATRMAQELMRMHGPAIQFGEQAPNLPVFPREVIPVLERNLEFLDEGDLTGRIESILREVQVLDARMRGLLSEGRSDPGTVRIGLIQCASVYARAESLFGYALNN